MGLDGVELVLAFEESFGVELKDQDVVETVTPRMVIDLIFSKLKSTDERVCQSQRAFYILRKAFCSIFGLDRKVVTPSMQFRELIPRSQEKEMWGEIRAAVAARSWPSLVRPLWMSRSLAVASLVIVCVMTCIGFTLGAGVGLGLVAGIIVVIPLATVATRLMRPWEVYIPSTVKSVRDLVPWVITSDQIRWTREQVAERVKQVVMDQLGVEESKYSENANFAKDFCMD